MARQLAEQSSKKNKKRKLEENKEEDIQSSRLKRRNG
jgi:hypothetical protein